MRLAMLCLSTNRPDTASVSLILSPIKAFIRSAILLFLLLLRADVLLLLSPSFSVLARQNPQVANQLSKNLILSPSECTS